jgi:hypothetical protein
MFLELFYFWSLFGLRVAIVVRIYLYLSICPPLLLVCSIHSNPLKSTQIHSPLFFNSQLAGVLNYPANTITVGGSYACNPKTTIKAKVNSCGDVNASVKQAVAKDCSLVGMASVKASDLSKSGTAAIKFGGSITLG